MGKTANTPLDDSGIADVWAKWEAQGFKGKSVHWSGHTGVVLLRIFRSGFFSVIYD